MTENRRIILNVIATYGRSLYSLVCGLFTARWVLMALGQVDYGLYGVIGGLTVFISLLNGVLSSAVSRFFSVYIGKAKVSASRHHGLEECRRWFSLAALVHTVVPCMLIAIGYPVGMYVVEHFINIPLERLEPCRWIFRIVCITCFVSMISIPYRAMYVAKQYIAELTVYSVATTTVNVVALYYMVSHPSDWLVRYAVWMCLITSIPELIILVRALIVFPECRLRYIYCIDAARMKQILAYAGWQLFGAFGTIFRLQGMQILVNKYFGPTINASVSVANGVSSQSATLASSMMGAFQPAIGNAFGEGKLDKMRSLAYRVCKFGLIASLIFVMPLALESSYVLTLWLETPPPYAAELCVFILLSILCDKASIGHMLAVNAAGKVALYQIFVGGIYMLTLPLAWLFIILGFGVLSIGWGIVAALALCSIARVLFARNLVGMSCGYWFLRIVCPICLAAIFSGGVGLFIKAFMSPSLLRLVTVVLGCEVAMLPFLWRCNLDNEERLYILTRVKLLFGGR